MPEPVARLATYEDLLALPEDVRAEVIGGHVHTAPAPLPRHGHALLALGRLLGGPFDTESGVAGDDAPGGWWILPEVDVRLGPHDIVRPDLAGWRQHRLPEPWDQRPIELAPDWVGEVLSPSTERYDRGAKMRLYARSGTEHCWLVDPAERTLEAYRRYDEGPGGPSWLLLGVWGDGDEVRIPPFDTLVLQVSRLFPPRNETG